MTRVMVAGLLVVSPAFAQTTVDPFPTPIAATEGVIGVNFVEFAIVPDRNAEPPRMMLLVDEPGTRRMFVNDMRGPLYSVSYDGKIVKEYLDINATAWGHPVQSGGNERGFQSFAFHPQFSQRGSRGYGKFYTYFDTSNIAPKADFAPTSGNRTHDTVLLEWTAKDPTAAIYDGGAPRGQDSSRRILFNDQGTQKTLLQLIREKNAAQGKMPAPRADLRFGIGPQGQILVLNKRDGVIRLLVP